VICRDWPIASSVAVFPHGCTLPFLPQTTSDGRLCFGGPGAKALAGRNLSQSPPGSLVRPRSSRACRHSESRLAERCPAGVPTTCPLAAYSTLPKAAPVRRTALRHRDRLTRSAANSAGFSWERGGPCAEGNGNVDPADIDCNCLPFWRLRGAHMPHDFPFAKG